MVIVLQSDSLTKTTPKTKFNIENGWKLNYICIDILHCFG